MKLPQVIKDIFKPRVGDNPIVEWEVTMKCNYSCSYCTNLDKGLYAVVDEARLDGFIRGLGETYPGTEIFVFGGEPWVHPKIGHIIRCFDRYQIPFVVQTNFSDFSVDRMEQLADLPWTINISVHPTEVGIDDFLREIRRFRAIFGGWDRIKIIDVMASGRGSVDYYLAIKREMQGYRNLFYTPITDFGDGQSMVTLNEYIRMRRSSVYHKIIQFEDVERYGRPRSEVWADPEFTPLGKPCLYQDRYFLYSSDLTLNNCCYRGFNTTGICGHDKCFLM